jgi:hypothetical protein
MLLPPAAHHVRRNCHYPLLYDYMHRDCYYPHLTTREPLPAIFTLYAYCHSPAVCPVRRDFCTPFESVFATYDGRHLGVGSVGTTRSGEHQNPSRRSAQMGLLRVPSTAQRLPIHARRDAPYRAAQVLRRPENRPRGPDFPSHRICSSQRLPYNHSANACQVDRVLYATIFMLKSNLARGDRVDLCEPEPAQKCWLYPPLLRTVVPGFHARGTLLRFPASFPIHPL